MGAALLTIVRPAPWQRWGELTGAERVGLYTRQSLYFVLWTFSGGILLSAAVELDGDAAGLAVLLGGGLAVTALGHATMQALLARHPTLRPLPRGLIAALLAAVGAYAVAAALVLEGPPHGSAVTVAVASVVLSVGLLPDPRLSVAIVVGSALLVGVSGGALVNFGAGLLLGAALMFTARASMWVYGIVTELDTARQAQAQLAVVEERLRFSRDVHDVLGRRLSTIAVQAELAATLAARGDERAAERMLEVRGVAHEALREARELARGYRSTDVEQELEGARSLLRSAGIDVRLDVGAVPRAWHEAAGWVVRESVTNVLRHSRAGLVEITYAGGELRIVNDGAGGAAAAADGSGLRGLRERLAPLGASLTAGPDGGDRWAVAARLPGTGPLSATGEQAGP